jgi:hypothetical protein
VREGGRGRREGAEAAGRRRRSSSVEHRTTEAAAPSHGDRRSSLAPCAPPASGDGDDHPAASPPLPRLPWAPCHVSVPGRAVREGFLLFPVREGFLLFPVVFPVPVAGCFPGNRDGKTDSAAMAYTGVGSLMTFGGVRDGLTQVVWSCKALSFSKDSNLPLDVFS